MNRILDWKCFTADLRGRPFGKPASEKKRQAPQPIPDRRISLLNKKFDLSDKSVLEVGCFEGIHTIGLCKFSNDVRALDSRIENVVKTMVRSGFFEVKPSVFIWDLERGIPQDDPRFDVDVVHHVGVLYHLSDPIKHLDDLAKVTKKALMLDTHYSTPEMAKDSYSYNGLDVKYFRYKEKGYKDVFSGMEPTSRWVTLDDIQKILASNGLTNFEVVEKRDERNGPRVLLFASR